jgi:hypothetical protein
MSEIPTEGVCLIRAWVQDGRVVFAIHTRSDADTGLEDDHHAIFDDPTEALDAVAQFLNGFAPSLPAR